MSPCENTRGAHNKLQVLDGPDPPTCRPVSLYVELRAATGELTPAKVLEAPVGEGKRESDRSPPPRYVSEALDSAGI